MSPDELATAIESLILSSDSRYVKAMQQIQADLYNQLSAILKDLELDNSGYLKQNSINRKILNDAESKIKEVFTDTKYTTSVSNYVHTITKVDLLNVEYFTAIDEAFSPKRIFLKNLQAETIAGINNYILQDGLQSQVIQPLVQVLNQNVNSGGQFAGFLEQVQTYVKGNSDVEGRALSYSRTYLRDSLFTYSRTYQQSITADLGLEWYFYSGGLIDSSRTFCVERAQKYYHHKEIESWASLDWAGKKQGTTESSIFLFAGGWNCAHQIIPVSAIIVPQDDLDRMK